MVYCGGGKLTWCVWQIGTTKGTGGDVLVLEEAAYCDEGFFYGVYSRCVACSGTQRRVPHSS
jgi:hypothetical protein